jgi:rare lipoprotein A
MNLTKLVTIILMLLLTSCTTPVKKSKWPVTQEYNNLRISKLPEISQSSKQDKEPFEEIGLASWYGSKWHGRKTASGKKFNKNSLTAAHKTLPFDSTVKVTNIENGKSVVVKVNDRGPYIDKRIIDTSERAAELLGFKQQGSTKVKLELVDNKEYVDLPAPFEKVKPSIKKSNSKANSKNNKSNYYIQVGSYKNKANALKTANKLASLGSVNLKKVQSSNDQIYRLMLGPIASKNEASKLLTKVNKKIGTATAKVLVN